MSEAEILRRQFRFLRSEEDDRGLEHTRTAQEEWERRVAKKYYERLYREYALADLSRYREGKIGLRWRTKDEVLQGKGQFMCGELCCTTTEDLRSFEVPFRYVERGERHETLIKTRLCPSCSFRLHYRTLKRRKRKQDSRRLASALDDSSLLSKDEATSLGEKTRKLENSGEVASSSIETFRVSPSPLVSSDIAQKEKESNEPTLDEWLLELNAMKEKEDAVKRESEAARGRDSSHATSFFPSIRFLALLFLSLTH